MGAHMTNILPTGRFRRLLFLACLCALALTLLSPGIASAHAILLNSNPAKDAVLRTPPTQVQMFFSEDLNPALSTAEVINATRKRVDANNAHVNPGDSKELDLTLQTNLPPDVYVVVWRSDSADDGHVLLGSFEFTVANPDGTVPRLAVGANPGQGVLGSGNASAPGTLDGPTIFNLIAITLAEIAAIFWVGAQFWANFVLQPSAEKYQEEQGLNTQVERRFESRFSLPTLILLLLANLGVLYGQVLTLTGNNWSAALNWQLLSTQATSGRFGTYWSARVLVLFLALLLSLYMLVSRRRPRVVNATLPLVNLFLGVALFVAMTLSGHAAAVSALLLPYSVVADWLHLVASALWIGGMFYILLVYLPVLKARSLNERARSLLAVLPQYSPLAIAGVVLLSITGPLNATFHLTSLEQFFTTAYGRALVVKIALVGALLLTSAYHVVWLRPRMKREYQKYTYAKERLEKDRGGEERSGEATTTSSEDTSTAESRQKSSRLLAQQVKLREGRLTRQTTLLERVLAWEPWLGVALLVCVGLMNVFAGTLTSTSAAASPVSSGPSGSVTRPFVGTAKTSDGKYSVTLNISPNQFGTNVFTVQVTALSNGKQLGANEAGVTVYTTMLDMAMGTDNVNLQPDGKGGFSGSGDLAMGGNWGIKVQVRTPDNTLHEASFKIYTPF